jgi:hypothetical protein
VEVQSRSRGRHGPWIVFLEREEMVRIAQAMCEVGEGWVTQ